MGGEADADVFRFRLSLDALGNWLKNPDEAAEEIHQDGSDRDVDAEASFSKLRNIWKNDLLLENATDRYVPLAFDVQGVP